MICTFCGSEIKDGDKFCMSCGTSVAMMKVGGVVAADAPANVTAPIEQQDSNVVAAMPVENQTVAPSFTSQIPEPVQPQVSVPVTPVQPQVSSENAGVAEAMTAGSAYFANAMQSIQPQQIDSGYSQPSASTYAQPIQNFGQNTASSTGAYSSQYSQNYSNTQTAYSQPSYSNTAYQNPAYQTPAYAQQTSYSNGTVYGGQAASSTEAAVEANPILILGIVALATAAFPAVSGLICGIMANVKYGAIVAKYGTATPTKAKVGRGLGIGGIVVGAIYTFFYFILFIGILSEM